VHDPLRVRRLQRVGQPIEGGRIGGEVHPHAAAAQLLGDTVVGDGLADHGGAALSAMRGATSSLRWASRLLCGATLAPPGRD